MPRSLSAHTPQLKLSAAEHAKIAKKLRDCVPAGGNNPDREEEKFLEMIWEMMVIMDAEKKMIESYEWTIMSSGESSESSGETTPEPMISHRVMSCCGCRSIRPTNHPVSTKMKGNSHEYPSDEVSTLPPLNTAPRRRSSTSKPLNALKRMSSVLTSSRHKEDNKSQESLFTQLDNLADHPQYCPNPAPGLGYKPVKTATSKGGAAQPLARRSPYLNSAIRLETFRTSGQIQAGVLQIFKCLVSCGPHQATVQHARISPVATSKPSTMSSSLLPMLVVYHLFC